MWNQCLWECHKNYRRRSYIMMQKSHIHHFSTVSLFLNNQYPVLLKDTMAAEQNFFTLAPSHIFNLSLSTLSGLYVTWSRTWNVLYMLKCLKNVNSIKQSVMQLTENILAGFLGIYYKHDSQRNYSYFKTGAPSSVNTHFQKMQCQLRSSGTHFKAQ